MKVFVVIRYSQVFDQTFACGVHNSRLSARIEIGYLRQTYKASNFSIAEREIESFKGSSH